MKLAVELPRWICSIRYTSKGVVNHCRGSLPATGRTRIVTGALVPLYRIRNSNWADFSGLSRSMWRQDLNLRLLRPEG